MRAEDTRVFSHFFEGNRRKYIIPVYQRNYDWTLEQCKTLFDDLISLERERKTHFIGTIVQKQNGEYEQVYNFIVIDGQQRITTIYLLLKALMRFEENQGRLEVLEDSVFNNFKGYTDYDHLEENKLKIKANPKDNIVLKQILNDDLTNIDITSNIYKNYVYFQELIGEHIKLDYTTLEIRKSIERLVAVVVSLDNQDDPQVVFERINSTGIPLTLDDLVRNYVLMTESEQERLFNTYWVVIEKLISKKNRELFLLVFLNTFLSDQVLKRNSYEMFKKWSEIDNKSKEDILIILSRFASYYSQFIGESKNINDEINGLLTVLRTLDQSTPYTFIFHIFELKHEKKINDKELVKILKFIINYSIRRIVCEIPSNSQKGLYKNLFRRIYSNLEEPINYYDVLVSFLLNNVEGTYDNFPKDDQFYQYLIETRLYRNRKFSKFILSNLENHNSKEKLNLDLDIITIEHILPQNEHNSEWRKSLGEDFERVYNTYLDTLGNITLTGYNSELSDNSFARKQEILKKQNVKITHINDEFINSKEWTEVEINKRADRLAREIIQLYPTPEYTGKIYKKKSGDNVIMFDLNNPERATGLKPISFELNGEKTYESKYVTITIKVIEKLHELDPQKLKGLALEKFKPFGEGTRIYLSTNNEDMKYYEMIKNTGIYTRVGLSSRDLLMYLKRLFDEFELLYDSLLIEAKKN